MHMKHLHAHAHSSLAFTTGRHRIDEHDDWSAFGIFVVFQMAGL